MWQPFISLLFSLFFFSTPFNYFVAEEQAIIIKLEDGFEIETILERLQKDFDLKIVGIENLSPRLNIHAIKIKNQQFDLAAIQKIGGIQEFQWDGPVAFRRLPDDEEYDRQWGLERINAPEAWDLTTGGISANGDTIVVAILDDGFDIDHEDIVSNIWVNKAEIPNDGQDNDNNGYVDDLYGWDFNRNTGNLAVSGHGHSVSGIIGATGNNRIGVTGINWNIKLMLFKTISVSAIISAYDYVIEQRLLYNESRGKEGAFVVATNASFGQSSTFCREQPVWGSMYDEMGKVGVLTGAGTVNTNQNVEVNGDMPTTCTSNFLITTLNTDISDEKHSSSGFGETSIDIGSPGDGSYTTKPFDRYGSFGGNSAAAPHLTGAIALMYSIPCQELADGAISDPQETALQIKDAILEGVDPVLGLKGITLTGGRLNILNSIDLLGSVCSSTSGVLKLTNVFPNPTDGLIQFEYETPDFEDYELSIFNALGQLVHQETILPNKFGKKIYRNDFPNLINGTYFIQLHKGDRSASSKFVIFHSN